MKLTTEYDLKSLQHEQHMLELYRRGSAGDGGLLGPLANACWRATAFDWRLHEDAGSVRRLWAEGASALCEGFARKRAGFERSPSELLLALHFSIASKTLDLVSTLMHMTPAASRIKTRRFARSPLLLLEGYLLLTRAILERNREHARAAQSLLEEARAESDYEWWKEQFPSAVEVAWKIDEHEATRRLLSVIARVVANENHRDDSEKFAELMDEALLNLDEFIESEVNHRPKLYFWLPGVALSILAESAGLSLDWLTVRQQDHRQGYARLPLELVVNNA